MVGILGFKAMLRCFSVVFIPTVIPTVVLTFVVAAGIGIALSKTAALARYSISWLCCSVRRSLWCPLWRLFSWGGKFLLSLGDVARYFSTSQPLFVRMTASSQARKLIEELHDRLSPTFPKTRRSDFGTRIIVVGHSLGSVIAYDVVHSAWRARHNDIPVPSRRFQ